MSTGAHLHYEIWRRGARVNPVSAKVPQGTVLAGAELGAFRAQKSRIDRMVHGDDTDEAVTEVASATDDPKYVKLRR